MLYSLRLLLFLINVDQTTVLNWFDMNLNTKATLETWQNINVEEDQAYKSIELESLKLLMNDLWISLKGGLSISDIENVIFFLTFVQFIILIFRYNLKTSTYITCIGLCAAFLWYHHLLDTIETYRQYLAKIPYFRGLGLDAVEMKSNTKALLKENRILGTDSVIHWYDPGNLLVYAVSKGIVRTDVITGMQYYIDPLSMVISSLDEDLKVQILPYYYLLYNVTIPRLLAAIGDSWAQFSGVAAYALVTRLGKRYCPYLIRWHWTFLLIFGFAEQIMIYFVYRIMYFQQAVIQPNMVFTKVTKAFGKRVVTVTATDPGLLFQFNALNLLMIVIVTVHIGSILFALLHALCGQYFYCPFLTENTELHVGDRPRNSVYSGGLTAWQDIDEKPAKNKLKLWYGWLGSGTRENGVLGSLKQFLINNIIKLSLLFKK